MSGAIDDLETLTLKSTKLEVFAMVLIKITINGQDQGAYTTEAYEELRLQMSTGDFHVHKPEVVVVNTPNWDEVIDLDLLLNQLNGAV